MDPACEPLNAAANDRAKPPTCAAAAASAEAASQVRPRAAASILGKACAASSARRASGSFSSSLLLSVLEIPSTMRAVPSTKSASRRRCALVSRRTAAAGPSLAPASAAACYVTVASASGSLALALRISPVARCITSTALRCLGTGRPAGRRSSGSVDMSPACLAVEA